MNHIGTGRSPMDSIEVSAVSTVAVTRNAPFGVVRA